MNSFFNPSVPMIPIPAVSIPSMPAVPVNPISAPAQSVSLEELVRTRRLVLDRSVFRQISKDETYRFFSSLSSLLARYHKRVLTLSETGQELEVLAAKNNDDTACVLAREQGLPWFNTLKEQGLMDVEPPIPIPAGRRFVPCDAAHLLRIENLLTHARSAGEPTAVLTRSRELAEDIEMLQRLRIIQDAVMKGAMRPIDVFLIQSGGVIKLYRPGMNAAPRLQNPVNPAQGIGRQPAAPASHPAKPNACVRKEPVLTDIPDEPLSLPSGIGEGSTLYMGENACTLGALIGQGSEANVYEVKGDDRLAAKIFFHMTKRKAEKLRLLCGRNIPGVVLPVRLLTKEKKGGAAIGYLMPRIHGAMSLADLFDENQRSMRKMERYFDRRQFVKVAGILVKLLCGVSQAGVFPTDLNPENILLMMDRDGYYGSEMVLIDADGFQVDASRFGGRGVIPGDGYTEDYWPLIPQMDSRTILKEEDFAYMAGELAFKTCMVGAHPFAGKPDERFENRSLFMLSRDGMFGYATKEIEATTAQPPEAFQRLWRYMAPQAQTLFAEMFCANSPRRVKGEKTALRELFQALDDYHRWINTQGVDPRAWEVHP